MDGKEMIREFIVKAMTGWTEQEIMKSLSDDFKKMEFISGVGSKKGKVRITISVERLYND